MFSTRVHLSSCLAGAALAILSRCGPIRDGPQLRTIPEGLGFSDAVRAARHPLSSRTPTGQWAYVAPGGAEWTESVTITRYAAGATRADAEAARVEAGRRDRSGRGARSGPLADLRIDGRDAWAWVEDDPGKDRLAGRAFVAVVPYQSETYGIVYQSSGIGVRPEEELRPVVASFIVARKARTDGWAFLLAGLALGAVVALQWRQHRVVTPPAA